MHCRKKMQYLTIRRRSIAVELFISKLQCMLIFNSWIRCRCVQLFILHIFLLFSFFFAIMFSIVFQFSGKTIGDVWSDRCKSCRGRLQTLWIVYNSESFHHRHLSSSFNDATSISSYNSFLLVFFLTILQLSWIRFRFLFVFWPMLSIALLSYWRWMRKRTGRRRQTDRQTKKERKRRGNKNEFAKICE